MTEQEHKGGAMSELISRRHALAVLGLSPVAAVAAPSAVQTRVVDVFRADVPSVNGNVYPLSVLGDAVAKFGRVPIVESRYADAAPVGRVESWSVSPDGWGRAVVSVGESYAGMIDDGWRLMPTLVAKYELRDGGVVITEIVRVVNLHFTPAGEASWPRAKLAGGAGEGG